MHSPSKTTVSSAPGITPSSISSSISFQSSSNTDNSRLDKLIADSRRNQLFSYMTCMYKPFSNLTLHFTVQSLLPPFMWSQLLSSYVHVRYLRTRCKFYVRENVSCTCTMYLTLLPRALCWPEVACRYRHSTCTSSTNLRWLAAAVAVRHQLMARRPKAEKEKHRKNMFDFS